MTLRQRRRFVVFDSFRKAIRDVVAKRWPMRHRDARRRREIREACAYAKWFKGMGGEAIYRELERMEMAQ